MDNIYSFHTFVLPFMWRGIGGAKQSYEQFKKCFIKNPNWERYTRENAYAFDEKEHFDNVQEALLFYKEYQYFHPYVRSAIYGFDKGIVDNFSFTPAQNKKGEYHIYKGDQHYLLHINAIKLRIFNTGVALFILETENHGTDGNGNPQNTLEAVKNINDYGRRITLPFINEYVSVSADKLEIKLDGIKDAFVDDYKDFVKTCVGTLEEVKNNVQLTHMCKFIKDILGYGMEGTCEFTSREATNKNEIYVFPALDDRMHVSCIVSDEQVTKNIRDNYETDDSYEKSLYELAYVDPSGGCTCQNSTMRKEYIQKSLYLRWMDEGSIYTVTNQAFIMLTTATYKTAGYLLDSFLTQYMQLVQLCLVQRASIIKYKREAASIASRIQGYGRKIDKKTVASIMDLQERYIAFQGQLCFDEVTPQEQGIEVYNMIEQAFYIEKESSSLKDLIDSLYEAANTTLSFDVNIIAVAFTFISAILSIAAIIFSWIFVSDVQVVDGVTPNFWALPSTAQTVAILATIGVCALIWASIILIYRRKK